MSKAFQRNDGRRAIVVVLLALFFAGVAPAVAQVTILGGDEAETESLRPEAFLTLHGDGCAVRYTSGGLDRAHHLLRRLELMTRQLNEWSDVPIPLVAYLLNRSEWATADLPGVYGVPIRLGPTSILQAVEGDDETVRFWRQTLRVAQLPMVPGEPLRGTADQAATMVYADLLIQVEAARGFVQRMGLLGAEPWVGEVAAHTVALTLFKAWEPGRMAEIGRFFATLEDRTPGLALNDYRPLLAHGSREDVVRWLGYQGRFLRAAWMLVDKEGKQAVKALLKLSRKARGHLPKDRLLDRYDGLGSWLNESFAAAGQ